MKTVSMSRDYLYQKHPRASVQFRAGVIYTRVLEAAAREIERAEAGRIVPAPNLIGATGRTIDASHAFKPRRH